LVGWAAPLSIAISNVPWSKISGFDAPGGSCSKGTGIPPRLAASGRRVISGMTMRGSDGTVIRTLGREGVASGAVPAGTGAAAIAMNAHAHSSAARLRAPTDVH
jgi:hypothetical protein